MKLSVIIPCYNEEKTIDGIIKKVKGAKTPGVVREIIVVDDASYDNSYKILKKVHGIKLYRHSKNRGKGAAIRMGFAKATGEIVLVQDADLEYDPSYYMKLIDPIIKNKTDVVYGSRLKNYPLKFLGRKRTPYVTHYLGNRMLSIVTSILYGSYVSDMETCYKVIRKEVLDSLKLESDKFDIEPEITAKLLKKGYKIKEIPIKVHLRGYDEGKKITWKDGFAAIRTLLKYRFVD